MGKKGKTQCAACCDRTVSTVSHHAFHNKWSVLRQGDDRPKKALRLVAKTHLATCHHVFFNSEMFFLPFTTHQVLPMECCVTSHSVSHPSQQEQLNKYSESKHVHYARA